MSGILETTPVDRDEKAAQDDPGTTIVTSDDPQVDLISRVRMITGVVSVSTVLTPVERSKRVWTLTSLWTHRTRPRVTLKTAKTAVLKQRPHPSSIPWNDERRTKNGRLNSVVKPSTKSDQAHVWP